MPPAQGGGGRNLFKRVRLWSGLVLFTFVTSHLVNHSLGLISLDALDTGRDVFTAIWRSWPGQVVLYGALLTHLTLVLWTLYQRRTLRLGVAEAVQALLGLTIPFLLVEHVLGTRVMNLLFSVEDNYVYEILILWLIAPEKGALQIALLCVAWVHGCIGMQFWLKLKPWYPRAAVPLLVMALLVPVCSVFGFVAAGKEVALLARDDIWLEVAQDDAMWPMQNAVDFVGNWQFNVWVGFGGLLVFMLAARLVRREIERRQGVIRLTYPSGREVAIRPGTSVLEASRIAGIPHASVCDGRGRCSTCRVRIDAGRENLPEPSVEEARVLHRVGCPGDVRLACQLRPSADVALTPLLPVKAGSRWSWSQPGFLQGKEVQIAILFADIRSFTKMSERKLPFDVVFMLNRYFSSMGEAVKDAGGHLDKFIGDGVMALFGVEATPEEACRRALDAARRMDLALDALNEALSHDLKEPIRIGIGIHVGSVIVGRMGYEHATSFTAIGDAVNTASRLESTTKELGCQLVISEEVATLAGMPTDGYARQELAVRGREEGIVVLAIPRARELSLEECAPGTSAPESAILQSLENAAG